MASSSAAHRGGREVVIGPMEQFPTISADVQLWTVLAQAADLLETDPAQAERRAQAALRSAPGQQQALQLVIAARRAMGDLAGGRALLETMAAETPNLASVHFELGLIYAEENENESAVRALSRVVELEPAHPQAWRALADALVQTGDTSGAAKAYARHAASSIMDLKTLEQISALGPDQMQAAESVLREYLNSSPTDLMALQSLGRMYRNAGRMEPAESVFARALEIDPAFRSARLDYLSVLHQQAKSHEELRQLDILLEDEPENADYRYLRAGALSAIGKSRESAQYCEELVRAEPENPKFRLASAYSLRTSGRQNECIAAFREAIRLDSSLGEAWWGLANLKMFRFEPEEISKIEAQLARDDVSDENREFLHFTLGKALEDAADYERAFENYSRGNALIRAKKPIADREFAAAVERQKRMYTREFFRHRENAGCYATDPIFVLGLPRSGTTLVEQILASHSSVEGCGELPCMNAIARRLETKLAASREPDDVARFFDGEDLRKLGEEYLARCGPHRKSSRPFFVDKMPKNFYHLGLICTIFPRARVIDVRRHPLACCFSNFKQIFSSSSGPSYDLADIGHYYRGYVDLTAHFDRLLPGRVHRVVYEELVRDTEREIRRILDYCGLPMEESCLRFYETDRGIRTISSEQVRRPVYADSVAQWQNFEPWLGPLKVALGPVLRDWRGTSH